MVSDYDGVDFLEEGDLPPPLPDRPSPDHQGSSSGPDGGPPLPAYAAKVSATPHVEAIGPHASMNTESYGLMWHGVRSHAAQLAAAINAGVDMIMTPADLYGGQSVHVQLAHAQEAVGSGRVPIERIDDAVRRILRVKFKLGLTGGRGGGGAGSSGGGGGADGTGGVAASALPDPSQLVSCVGCARHRAVARRAVAGSAVLLCNRGNVLPLEPHNDSSAPTANRALLVTGDAAHNLGRQMGGWSLEWQVLSGYRDTIELNEPSRALMSHNEP